MKHLISQKTNLLICFLLPLIVCSTSCSKEKMAAGNPSFSKKEKFGDTTLLSEQGKADSKYHSTKGESSKIKYVTSLDRFKKKITINSISSIKGRSSRPIEIVSDDENTISFISGEHVGDFNDYVIAADGPIISAASQEEEEETRLIILDQIYLAKNYLNSHGLDFSDEYNYDDPRYIHAANIVLEMEYTKGIPLNKGHVALARENTALGCAMQAIGVKAVFDAFYDKVATKRMLIAAVGKVAARYLGFVGAAIAVYDFIDCMWG